MKAFAKLYRELDSTNSSKQKILHLYEYFSDCDPADGIWAVCLLSGQRPKRVMPSSLLRQSLVELTGYDEWLIEDSYAVVGDLAETISLLVEPFSETKQAAPRLGQLLNEIVPSITELPIDEKKNWLVSQWKVLESSERFLLNKILTGGFRVGVSKQLVAKALAKCAGVDDAEVIHRMTGKLVPTAESFKSLVAAEQSDAMPIAKPYPFYLAYPLEADPDELGEPQEWIAEWKWDGIRAQLIKRSGEVFLWSRGEDMIAESFPEIIAAAQALPDGTVLDGELLVHRGGPRPASFADLQRRLGRKNPSAKMQREFPVVMTCYDLIELSGQDIRSKELGFRRLQLEELSQGFPSELTVSTKIEFSQWQTLTSERLRSRELLAEGLMLKRRQSSYQVGRKKGDWWKWKVDPFTIDAVLLYAQAGHGRRSTLYTDYTLALWEGEKLVPVAKAYSGLTDEEFRQLDRWIKAHTKERFGPVRSVEAKQVLEIAFEGIAKSGRHKSGFALRFPRIHRWRQDKRVEEADKLESLSKLWESQQ